MTRIPPALFWSVIAIYLACRLTLAGLNYLGDRSPEARQRALAHFPPELIDRGIEYHRAGFGVAVFALLLDQAVLLLLVAGGFSERLGEWTLARAGGRVWIQTPLFLAILMLGAWLLALPFSWYFGYVLEHRFGFSNLTPGGWFLYEFKNAAVGAVLGLLLGSLAYFCLRRFERSWVWMVPVGALVLQLTLTWLFPRLLLPIFYRVEPVRDEKLLASLERVTEPVGVKIKSVFVINESQYSNHTNAFFTGFGRFKEIYLYDTLIRDHTEDEVAAVLAHELGHWRHNHVLKGLILSQGGIVLACVLLWLFFPLVTRSGFLHTGALKDVASLPTLALIATVVSFFLSPVTSGVSRYFERQADEFGLGLAPSPQVYIDDFKQLAESNHSNLLPHPAVVFWRHSHPPTLDRIEAVERALAASGEPVEEQ